MKQSRLQCKHFTFIIRLVINTDNFQLKLSIMIMRYDNSCDNSCQLFKFSPEIGNHGDNHLSDLMSFLQIAKIHYNHSHDTMYSNELVVVILSSIAIILHSFGLFALTKSRRRSVGNPYTSSQHLYLFNLSFSEVLYSLTGLLRVLGVLLKQDELSRIMFICNTCVFAQLTLMLTAITFDRFLSVYYGLKYVLVWTVTRSKTVLMVIYLIVIMMTTICIIYLKSTQQAFSIFSFYVWLPLDILFIVVAIFTYGYLLRKLLQMNAKPDRRQRGIKKSIIVVLGLVFSFAVFVIIPDIVTLVKSLRNEEYSMALVFYLSVSYRLGTISDAFIYIIFSPDVQSVAKNTFCC